ncbi:MAG: MarR family transcriptional regulator [Lachnospiraceae bacterium]|nr:MarR family transcriptional regulator [Lachnospiraceae bacterium]
MNGEKLEYDNDCFLWARKLKSFFREFSVGFREEYGLKQIDLEILFFLYRNPGASIGDIHRKQDLNKGQVSIAMNALKKSGYISVREKEGDRRYYDYSLTELAIKRLEKIVEGRNRMLCDLFKGFSKEELGVFQDMVDRIGNNIDSILEENKK